MALIAEVFVSDDTGNRGKQIRGCQVDSVTWKLNGIHSATVSIHPLLEDAGLILLDEMELAIPIRTKDSDNDYTYIWQGIPKTKAGNTSRLTFGVEFVSSYLQDAHVTADVDHVGVEQMNIQTGLVTLAQAPSDAGRNIAIGAYTGSGVFRERHYKAEEYPNIYELVAAFPELQDGFDWDIEIQSNGSRFFTPYYPRKGSQKDQHRISLDTTGSSEHWRGLQGYTESTVNTYTEVFVTGPNDEATGLKLVGHWLADSATLLKYGRKQGVFSENSEGTDQDWLDARAQQIGEDSLIPEQFPTIGLSDQLFGSLWHGDSFPLVIDYGAIQVNDDFRIMELTITPAGDVMSTKLQKA